MPFCKTIFIYMTAWLYKYSKTDVDIHVGMTELAIGYICLRDGTK